MDTPEKKYAGKKQKWHFANFFLISMETANNMQNVLETPPPNS